MVRGQWHKYTQGKLDGLQCCAGSEDSLKILLRRGKDCDTNSSYVTGSDTSVVYIEMMVETMNTLDTNSSYVTGSDTSVVYIEMMVEALNTLDTNSSYVTGSDTSVVRYT